MSAPTSTSTSTPDNSAFGKIKGFLTNQSNIALIIGILLVAWLVTTMIFHIQDNVIYEKYATITFQLIVVFMVIWFYLREMRGGAENEHFENNIKKLKRNLDEIDSVNMRRINKTGGDYSAITKQLNEISSNIKKEKNKKKNTNVI